MKFSKKLIIPALIIIALGVLIAVGPWTFAPVCEVPTDENPDGLWVMTKAGKQLPMPCGYTARAEIGVGTGIAIVGGMLIFATALGAIVALGAVAALMGATAIALPTTLTGTCALTSHTCNTMTLPTLEVLGIALIGVSLGVVVFRNKFIKP
ncbi:MAG: DUF4418 family protein [Methanomassiliicoccales archaeon]|jgi:hypothetical protein